MKPTDPGVKPNRNQWITAFQYAAVAMLVYIVFTAMLIPRAGGHPWGLLGFYKNLTRDDQTKVPQRFVSSQFGYDGQAYFVLSLSPFLKDPAPLGFRFDNQALRQQRILYPLTVHLFAWGNSSRTAWAMIIVNIMAVGAMVVFAARIFQRMGKPPWLSLLVGFYPGLAVSVPRGLTEPFALMWIVAAIYLWKRQPWTAGGLLGLAVLTRETALLVAAGFGCAWLWGLYKKASETPSARIWAVPLAVYLLWHGFLYFWVPDATVAAAALSGMGWPLTGLYRALIKLMTHPGPQELFFLFFIIMVLVWQFLVAGLSKTKAHPLFSAWILYGVLLSMAGLDIWDNSPGLLRVAGEWCLAGLLLVAGSTFTRWKRVAGVWMAGWLLSAAGEWYRYGLIYF